MATNNVASLRQQTPGPLNPNRRDAVPIAPAGRLKAAQPSEKVTPILKWAGGKSRILPQLRPLMPPAVTQRRLVEPFFGGGAMFFAEQPKRAVLSDVNSSLIATYQAVRDQLPAVIKALRPLAAKHSKEHYYAVRERYNTRRLSSADHAAAFLYLNRTCFNGLHRVNRSGAFNVPFGRYKNPRIVNEDGLHKASQLLRRATLRNAGFEHVLETARPGDFVYFDPPYVPLSTSASFTSYAKGGFGPDEQRRLRDVVRELDRRGCHIMLSNSDTSDVRDLYKEFRIDLVAAPRAISCHARTRNKVTEVVVRNY